MGTDGGTNPFFSPDGAWIGFLAGDKVKKVAAEGGSAVTIGDRPSGSAGASWGEDGNIIIGSSLGLVRMPAGGGMAQPLKGSAGAQIFPQVLPGAKAVLFNYAPAPEPVQSIPI